MNLPTFWRRAAFTVSESAALTGASEDALRGWLARNTTNDFNGAKTGHRLYLSALDCFYYLLVRHLTQFGVPVRTAMFAAAQQANGAEDDLPRDEFLIVRTDGQTTDFGLTGSPEFGKTTLVLPLRALALDLLEAAAVVYAAEESGPVHQIGTVNGQPIAEWRAGIEAELARMPVNG